MTCNRRRDLAWDASTPYSATLAASGEVVDETPGPARIPEPQEGSMITAGSCYWRVPQSTAGRGPLAGEGPRRDAAGSYGAEPGNDLAGGGEGVTLAGFRLWRASSAGRLGAGTPSPVCDLTSRV
jgi:hypothetical protein